LQNHVGRTALLNHDPWRDVTSVAGFSLQAAMGSAPCYFDGRFLPMVGRDIGKLNRVYEGQLCPPVLRQSNGAVLRPISAGGQVRRQYDAIGKRHFSNSKH
jgi:hypothetical protein